MPARGRGQEPEFRWPELKQVESSGHGESGSRGELAPNPERPQNSPGCLRLVVHGKEEPSVHHRTLGRLGRMKVSPHPALPSQIVNLKGFCLGCTWQQGRQHHRPHWWEDPREETQQLELPPAWAALTTRGQHWTRRPRKQRVGLVPGGAHRF